MNLGASVAVSERFQVLETEHLKMSTTLLDPHQDGWKHAKLPWFWYLDVAGDSISASHLKECGSIVMNESDSCLTIMKTVHRVNWLRAKATFDRVSEELILVRHEMGWTIRYFQHHAEQWRRRNEEGRSPGHVMYAARQRAMWGQFAIAAKEAFARISE